MRGRVVWSVVDRGLLFKRIRDLEGVVDVYDVGGVVGHLRQLYGEYASKKLVPFTRCVEQALENYRHRQRRLQAGQDEGEADIETNDPSPSTRSPKRSRVSSGKSPSSSSVGSADEEGIFDVEVKPEFDLIKSSIREAYIKRRPQQTLNHLNKEEDVQEDNARVREMVRVNEIGAATPASPGQGDIRGSESKEMNIGPTFRDFGGIEKVIDELMMEVVVPLCHPQLPMALGVRPLSGILLHGPPGCGKTRLAQAIANETGVPFYKISATEIVSGVSG